jgi:hypothetical protein
MNPDAELQSNTGRPVNLFGPFVLATLGLMFILGWNAVLASRQHAAAAQARARQTDLLQQAANTERNLQALLMDLVVLARTDPQARAIVEKFKIQYNEPGRAGTAPGN